MTTSRAIRLQHDFIAMQAMNCDVLRWEAGDNRKPPEVYVVEYRLRGMIGPESFCDVHTVVIKLLAEYPNKPPVAKFISRPVLFHPHVFENGSVCVGGYSPEEGLAAFCLRIARYIQFQPCIINIKSPANLQALAWFHEHCDQLPVDNTPLPELPDRPNRPRGSGRFTVLSQTRIDDLIKKTQVRAV